MNNGEFNDKKELESLPKKRNVFAKLLKKLKNEPQSTKSEVPEDLPEYDKPFEMPYRTDGKPDYFHPSIQRLSDDDIREIVDGLGVERETNAIHAIHYVGDVSRNTTVDASKSFKDYAEQENVTDSQAGGFLYTGEFTIEDNAIIKKFLGYESRNMSKQDKGIELDKLSAQAREFMDNVVIPKKMNMFDALSIIQKDNLEPISFYHNLDSHGQVRDDKKILFWIDETFGGEITLKIGKPYTDSTVGYMTDGVISVSMDGKEIGALHWNNYQSNAVIRFNVDPFIRKSILNESPDNQVYSNL